DQEKREHEAAAGSGRELVSTELCTTCGLESSPTGPCGDPHARPGDQRRASTSHDAGPPLRVEARAANQNAVHTVGRDEDPRVPAIHTPAVQDRHADPALSSKLAQREANHPMHFRGVGRRRRPAGTDGPDRLVRDEHLTDLRRLQPGDASTQLTEDHLLRLAALTLLELLTDAEHR